MNLRFLVALGSVAAAGASAQPAAWFPLDGPYATNFQAVTVTPSGTPLAVSYTEIYRYSPAARTWTEVESTFTGSFFDIAAGPGQRVWAGTGGIFGSLNGGQAWDWYPVRTTPHSGVPASIERVAVGPDGTVYAAALVVDAGGEVVEGGYRSVDDGTTWPDMGVAPASMAFAGTTAFAGTLDGVFRSADRGASWTPSGLSGLAVHAMAASGTRLAAATNGSLWTSTDGATWTAVAAILGVTALATASDGSVWAAAPDGLYRSADGGASWAAAPAAFDGRTVADVAIGGATLCALVEGTPFLSTDAGQTWTAATGGFTLRDAMAAVAAGGVLAVSAVGAGPFVSRDAGASWTLWIDGLATQTVQQFVADPAAGWVVARAHNGLYRAALAGGQWAPLALPDDEVPLLLAYDGAGHLYVLARSDGSAVRFYRSADQGTTWTVPYELGTTDAISTVAAGGGVAAASVAASGGFGTRRLIVSADGGATWLERPYPVELPFGTPPAVWVDATGRIYVRGTSDRLLRSSDLGATWTPLGPSGIVLAILAESGGTLCLGLTRGVSCSTDDGATFTPVNSGLPPDPENGGAASAVLDLLRDGDRYYVLTPSFGLFGSPAPTRSEPGTSDRVGLSVPTPNPARGQTALTLTFAEPQAVTVAVFDALGRRVAVLHDGPLAAGTHTLAVDASALAPGVYVVRAVADGLVASRRLVVAR